MKCMNACPERAIQTAQGFVIGLLYLVFTIGMEWLYFFTVDKLADGQLHKFFENGNIRFLIASALSIPFLFLSYRIIHFLMRYRLFEKLVIYTSLTVFKFWRRYRAEKALGVRQQALGSHESRTQNFLCMQLFSAILRINTK